MSGPSRQAINASYHPQSGGPSPSLQRARKPFRFGNAIIGSTIALFAAGVYTYSISSVRQDDFSDVEDLLPPLAERTGIRSIEDESRALSAQKQTAFQSIVSTLPSRPPGGASPPPPSANGLTNVPVTGAADSPSKALPSSVGMADAELGIGASGSGLKSAYTAEEVEGSRNGLLSALPWPKRLDEVRWVRERGLVELGKGNVVVWGAPNVDRVGNISDDSAKRNKGARLV